MTAWSRLSSDERDRIFLAAAFLTAPGPVYVNPRSKNDREWAADLVARGLLTERHAITQRGKSWLKTLSSRPAPDQQSGGGNG